MIFLFVSQDLIFLILLISKFKCLMADTNRAGPLVEYERRIASGELMDGDTCQV